MVVRELTATSPARTDLGRYRWAAVLASALALASVGTHAWMLITMPASVATHLVVLVMAAACLWCGLRAARNPRVQEWTMTAAMGAGMVAAHLVMTGSAPHAMSGSMAENPMGHSDAMSVALVLALVEMVVAVAVIWRLTARSEPAHLAESPSHRYL